jgi:hypothetical protein
LLRQIGNNTPVPLVGWFCGRDIPLPPGLQEKRRLWY